MTGDLNWNASHQDDDVDDDDGGACAVLSLCIFKQMPLSLRLSLYVSLSVAVPVCFVFVYWCGDAWRVSRSKRRSSSVETATKGRWEGAFSMRSSVEGWQIVVDWERVDGVTSTRKKDLLS